MNVDIKIDSFIDITNDFCPMTFVKTKLRLKEMSKGEVLEVKLSDENHLNQFLRILYKMVIKCLRLYLMVKIQEFLLRRTNGKKS